MYFKYLTLPFSLLCLFLLTSCLTSTDQEDTPSQFAIDLQLEGVTATQIVEEDTLQITQISFLQGSIALESAGEDSAVLYTGTGVFNYQFPASEQQRLLTGEVAGGTYNTMLYNINKADADNENIPGSFIDGEEEDQRYSMIITGQYNDSSFTYKSTQPFNFEFDLGSPVEIPENNTSLTLAINFDVHRVFMQADSALIDPSNPDNAEQIDSNIEAAIELLPFN